MHQNPSLFRAAATLWQEAVGTGPSRGKLMQCSLPRALMCWHFTSTLFEPPFGSLDSPSWCRTCCKHKSLLLIVLQFLGQGFLSWPACSIMVTAGLLLQSPGSISLLLPSCPHSSRKSPCQPFPLLSTAAVSTCRFKCSIQQGWFLFGPGLALCIKFKRNNDTVQHNSVKRISLSGQERGTHTTAPLCVPF